MKKKENAVGVMQKENLKVENELLKEKLKSEFGMKGMKSELPDELENDWLNYIYDFEKLHKDAKEISVYERLGKPEFKKTSNMNDEEVTSELSRLYNLMDQNGLVLNTLCDYNDRIIYEFVVEELFKEMISDIRIEGMRTNFIYEEFHQNHEYDIKESIDSFFRFFLDQDVNEQHIGFIYLDNEIKYKGKLISKDDFIKIIMCFREEVKPAGVEVLEFHSVNFDLEKKQGSASGEISYTVLENGLPSAHVSDTFKMDLKLDEFSFWIIKEINFP